jgi:hypothetical protein
MNWGAPWVDYVIMGGLHRCLNLFLVQLEAIETGTDE